MDKEYLEEFDTAWIALNRAIVDFEDVLQDDKVIAKAIKDIDHILHYLEKDHLDKFYPKVLREKDSIKEFVNIRLPKNLIVGEVIEQVYEKDDSVYIALSNDRIIKIDTPEVGIAIKGKWLKRIDYSIIEGNKIQQIFNDPAGITLILDNHVQFNLDFPKAGELIEAVDYKNNDSNYSGYDASYIDLIEKEIKKSGFIPFSRKLNQSQMDYIAQMCNYPRSVNFVFQFLILSKEKENIAEFNYYSTDDNSVGVIMDADSMICTKVFESDKNSGKIFMNNIIKYLKNY